MEIALSSQGRKRVLETLAERARRETLATLELLGVEVDADQLEELVKIWAYSIQAQQALDIIAGVTNEAQEYESD
jgi:hypothetical protein